MTIMTEAPATVPICDGAGCKDSSLLGGRRHVSPRHSGSSPREAQIVEIDIPANARESVSRAAAAAAEALPTDIERDPRLMARRGEAILLQHLTPATRNALGQLAKPSPTTLLILRGLIDLHAPPTPVTGFIEDRLLAAQDILLAGALRVAGTTPVAYPFENQGRIARNVVANPNQRGSASSHGFDVPLFFHQDNCGQPFEGEVLPNCSLPPMPSQLGFLAIRNEERVPTRVVLLDDVLSLIAPTVLDALRQESFRIGAPDSVSADGFGSEAIEHASIVRERRGFLESRFDPFLVTPDHPSAAAANAGLILAVAAALPMAVDVMLDAGDLLIFKNYRLLHMRVAFVPATRERSRWLRRIYGRSDVGE